VNAQPEKILALQFKYFGDAVFMTPALRALHEHFPTAELHLLVPQEIAPLFQHLSWLTRVWPMPRRRGRASFGQSWPILRALRHEHFDRCVDFAGNDRGAILSRLSGAPNRLGSLDKSSKWFRRLCYSKFVGAETLPKPWLQRHVALLAAWQVPPPKSSHMEIVADPALAEQAAELLPANRILCHLATSQPKKEWPLASWAEFYHLASAAGYALAFSSGTNDRERALLTELSKLEPNIFVLPPVPELKLFLAVLRRARAVISGDTGPLHFAAGLGVPVIGLCATRDSIQRIVPIYPPGQIVIAAGCACERRLKNFAVCQDAHPCMGSILPEQVLAALNKTVGES
jgi:ADP-heptose:LPS heptosyltransferase